MKCKVTKFWEVNYKILARILATPVVITAVNPNLGTPICFLCSQTPNLHHIMLDCTGTVTLRLFIMDTLELTWTNKVWIFGTNSTFYNPIIWLLNFTIYKAHLLALNGEKLSLKQCFLNKCEHYALLFPVVHPFIATSQSGY